MKVSKTGYKKNSKDKNQPSLLIPSNRITMKNVEFPVYGVDDTGYSQMMYPGSDYTFPGNYVYELPVKKGGGHIVPGRYRNPEGNWLNKYQSDTTSGEVIYVTDPEDPRLKDYQTRMNLYKYSQIPNWWLRTDIINIDDILSGEYDTQDIIKGYEGDPFSILQRTTSEFLGPYGSNAIKVDIPRNRLRSFVNDPRLRSSARITYPWNMNNSSHIPADDEARMLVEQTLQNYPPDSYQGMISYTGDPFRMYTALNPSSTYGSNNFWTSPETQFIEDHVNRNALRAVYPFLSDKEIDDTVSYQREHPYYTTNVIDPLSRNYISVYPDDGTPVVDGLYPGRLMVNLNNGERRVPGYLNEEVQDDIYQIGEYHPVWNKPTTSVYYKMTPKSELLPVTYPRLNIPSRSLPPDKKIIQAKDTEYDRSIRMYSKAVQEQHPGFTVPEYAREIRIGNNRYPVTHSNNKSYGEFEVDGKKQYVIYRKNEPEAGGGYTPVISDTPPPKVIKPITFKAGGSTNLLNKYQSKTTTGQTTKTSKVPPYLKSLPPLFLEGKVEIKYDGVNVYHRPMDGNPDAEYTVMDPVKSAEFVKKYPDYFPPVILPMTREEIEEVKKKNAEIDAQIAKEKKEKEDRKIAERRKEYEIAKRILKEQREKELAKQNSKGVFDYISDMYHALPDVEDVTGALKSAYHALPDVEDVANFISAPVDIPKAAGRYLWNDFKIPQFDIPVIGSFGGLTPKEIYQSFENRVLEKNFGDEGLVGESNLEDYNVLSDETSGTSNMQELPKTRAKYGPQRLPARKDSKGALLPAYQPIGGNDSLARFTYTFNNDITGADSLPPTHFVTPKIKELTGNPARPKKWENSFAVGDFLRDADITENQYYHPDKYYVGSASHPLVNSDLGIQSKKLISASNQLVNDPEKYWAVYKWDPKNPGAAWVRYLKTNEIKSKKDELLKQGWHIDMPVSGQHKFDDVDWDGKGSDTGYKADSEWVPLKKGASQILSQKGAKHTFIPQGTAKGQNKGTYNLFSGGSITFIWKDPVTNERLASTLAGSISDMKLYGEKLKKDYDLKDGELEIIYHDTGSYSAKPAAKNGTLYYDQWKNYNSYNKGYSGAALIVPTQKWLENWTPNKKQGGQLNQFQKGGSHQRIYTDPEEFKIANQAYQDSLEGFRKFPLLDGRGYGFSDNDISRADFSSFNNLDTGFINILNKDFANSLSICPSNMGTNCRGTTWVYKRPTEEPVYEDPDKIKYKPAPPLSVNLTPPPLRSNMMIESSPIGYRYQLHTGVKGSQVRVGYYKDGKYYPFSKERVQNEIEENRIPDQTEENYKKIQMQKQQQLKRHKTGGPTNKIKLQKGGIPMPTIVNDPTAGRSYYDPIGQVITIGTLPFGVNPRDVREHELFHHLQNINGGLHLGTPAKRPAITSTEENAADYFNRKNFDVDNIIDEFNYYNPSFQFVPNQVIYDKYADDAQYNLPWTVEGEAQDYENYIKSGGKSMFKKNGGWLDKYQGVNEGSQFSKYDIMSDVYADVKRSSVPVSTYVNVQVPTEKDIQTVQAEAQRVKKKMKQTGAKSEAEVYAKEQQEKQQEKIFADIRASQGVIKPAEEKTYGDYIKHALDILKNPLTAAGYKIRGQEIPWGFTHSSQGRNPMDYAVDVINPAFYASAAGRLLDAAITPETYTHVMPQTASAVLANIAGDQYPSEWDESAWKMLGYGLDALALRGNPFKIPRKYAIGYQSPSGGRAALGDLEYIAANNPKVLGSLNTPFGKLALAKANPVTAKANPVTAKANPVTAKANPVTETGLSQFTQQAPKPNTGAAAAAQLLQTPGSKFSLDESPQELEKFMVQARAAGAKGPAIPEYFTKDEIQLQSEQIQKYNEARKEFNKKYGPLKHSFDETDPVADWYMREELFKLLYPNLKIPDFNAKDYLPKHYSLIDKLLRNSNKSMYMDSPFAGRKLKELSRQNLTNRLLKDRVKEEIPGDFVYRDGLKKEALDPDSWLNTDPRGYLQEFRKLPENADKLSDQEIRDLAHRVHADRIQEAEKRIQKKHGDKNIAYNNLITTGKIPFEAHDMNSKASSNFLSKGLIPSSINAHITGLRYALKELMRNKNTRRPLSEIFPVTKASQQQILDENNKIYSLGNDFYNKWVYDDQGMIRPEVGTRIQNIIAPPGSGYTYQPNYAYDMDPTNPFITTPDKIVNTRNINSNKGLTKNEEEIIKRNRATALGVNSDWAPTSLTFNNFGYFGIPFRKRLETFIHEKGHTFQDFGEKFISSLNGNSPVYHSIPESSWGKQLAKHSDEYKYFTPNLDTEIGRKFAEAMREPVKGKDNWSTSPTELHSELMVARFKLVEQFMKRGYSMDEAINIVKQESDEMLDYLIEAGNLDRFFKKTTSKEKKYELLRILPALIPLGLIGGLGAVSAPEEKKYKKYGGSTKWLDKYEKGGVNSQGMGYFDYINGYGGVSS